MPGFYYDPVKKKYFKIQSNNFGVQSVITNQSIVEKNNLIKFKSTAGRNPSINLIDKLFKIQLGQFETNLLKDLQIVYMKQLRLVSLENSVQIKKMTKFKLASNEKSIYFLLNISGYLNNLVQCLFVNSSEIKRNMVNLNYASIRFNHIADSDEFFDSSHTLRSSGLAYIQNNSYLVTDQYPSDGNKKQKITISHIDYYNREQLNAKAICVKLYALPMWCTTLNSNSAKDNRLDKIAIGFPKNAIVAGFDEERNEQILDSMHTDVYCARFKPSVQYHILNLIPTFKLKSKLYFIS